MKTVELRISNNVGLHAQPASALVTKAMRFKSDIKLEFDETIVDVKSILGLMSLGIPGESFIKLHADGEDEEQALKTLVNELYDYGVIER